VRGVIAAHTQGVIAVMGLLTFAIIGLVARLTWRSDRGEGHGE